jgi:hypothetical protein
MQFCDSDSSIFESDTRYTLHLSPSAFPVILPKPLDVANSCSYGNGLDNSDLTDNFEIHRSILASTRVGENFVPGNVIVWISLVFRQAFVDDGAMNIAQWQ